MCNWKIIFKAFWVTEFDEKKSIIEIGRPTPKLPCLTTKSKNYVRTFKYEYYSTFKWLSDCKKTNKLYCWPCVIFSREENVWTKYGFNDLNNFHHLKRRHEAYKNHIQCLIDLTKLGKIRIDTCLSEAFRKNIEKHNVTVKNNRYILSSMIDSTCFLAQQELAFRGHDESDSSVNRGNYVELIYLMVKNTSCNVHYIYWFIWGHSKRLNSINLKRSSQTNWKWNTWYSVCCNNYGRDNRYCFKVTVINSFALC